MRCFFRTFFPEAVLTWRRLVPNFVFPNYSNLFCTAAPRAAAIGGAPKYNRRGMVSAGTPLGPAEVVAIKGGLTIRAEVPGFAHNDVEVHVEPTRLIIYAKAREISGRERGEALATVFGAERRKTPLLEPT